MPGLSSRGIFLSYRREDAAPYARLLQFQLGERIPDARVFIDLDSIEAGLDFAEVIREAVASCVVLVALIGRQWATIVDEEGRRRLDDPNDYVRYEIQAALERDVRVIPVLVDGARPLRQQQLPSELHKLARLNALELSYGRYEYDADRLLNLIQRVLDAIADASTVDQSRSSANIEILAVSSEVRPGGTAISADPDRAARLIADAERLAQSITSEKKATALADIARAVAATDPNRAARLIADAERLAQSISDEAVKADAISGVAKALAATDPDRAEHLAQSITEGNTAATTLSHIAKVLAATDPRRAARLIADAEHLAQSITSEALKVGALADIAEAQAATDPDRAERLAQSITSEAVRATALAQIAGAVAATDADRAARLTATAEHLAQSLTGELSILDKMFKVGALTVAGWAVAATDPDRAARLIADAERVAQSITNELLKAIAFTYIAWALTAIDPDRAERTARSITENGWKVRALVMSAEPRAMW